MPNGNIGRPRRAFVYLEESGRVDGPVLDVGCGTGELASFLATRGHDVLGIDLSPRAVDQAKAKARWRRISGAHFLVWDALDLPELTRHGFRFRTVTDSARFHVLPARDRDGFVDALETVLAPAATTSCWVTSASTSPRPTASAPGTRDAVRRVGRLVYRVRLRDRVRAPPREHTGLHRGNPPRAVVAGRGWWVGSQPGRFSPVGEALRLVRPENAPWEPSRSWRPSFSPGPW